MQGINAAECRCTGIDSTERVDCTNAYICVCVCMSLCVCMYLCLQQWQKQMCVCRGCWRARSDLLGELGNSGVEGDHPSAEVHVALSCLSQAFCLCLVLGKSLLEALLHVLLH